MKPASAARLAALSGIWGASFLFIKVAVGGMHPTLVALGRIAVGAAVVVAWWTVRRDRSRPAPLGEWPKFAVMAVVGNMLPFTLISSAEQHITSALASILNATTPLMTALAAVFVMRVESMTPIRTLGVLVGFSGVATIVVPGAELGAGHLWGPLMVVAATACYGIAGTFARRFITSSPLEAATGQLALATVGMGAVAVLSVRGSPISLTPARALSVVALGALGTGVGWVLYLRIINDESATTASLVTYLVPIISVVLGRVVLGEALRWNAYVGGLVVIAGIALAEGRFARPRVELRVVSGLRR